MEVAKNAVSNSVIKCRRKRMRYIFPVFITTVVILLLFNLSKYQESMNRNEAGEAHQVIGSDSFVQADANFNLELWKLPTLLNLNFTWLSNNEAICQQNKNDSKNLRLLPILIPSSSDNLHRRLAIRKAYGSLKTYKNWDIRLIFLLGQVDPLTKRRLTEEQLKNHETMLQDEQTVFHDLVIGSFMDTYRNLSLKHLMGYKWILNYCREANFIWKLDDDVFFDIIHWLDWHSDELEKVTTNDNYTLPDLLCISCKEIEPVRNIPHPLSQWLVSYNEWPHPLYPDYCSGFAYSITLDFMEKIYAVSNSRKMFWIDDIFVTGVLREAAEKAFNLKPEIKEIGDQVTYDEYFYRPMCENRAFHLKRKFKSLIEILEPKLLKDMMCLWNKTIYDMEKVHGNLSAETISFHRLSKQIVLDAYYR